MTNQISAKIIADSICNGYRITTLQLRMPRFLLAQLNTHRMFSRNAASSRAIPVDKLIEQVRNNPFIPEHFAANKAGMVAGEELSAQEQNSCLFWWKQASEQAVIHASRLKLIGTHKQWINRILEPFLMVDVLVTATEWGNFFKLRLAEDSQPEMQKLAQCMLDAIKNGTPVERTMHIPYVDVPPDSDYGMFHKYAKLSAARCARVSYSNHDGSKVDEGKDKTLAEKLLSAGHMSPFEHAALFDPMGEYMYANFKRWCSYRTLNGSYARLGE